MNEKECPKCGIPYSDSKITCCLLCGAVLTSNQQVTEPSPVEAQVTKEEAVPPFDDKGGFSPKNTKRKLEIEQLRVDKEAIEKRLNTFEEIYRKEHPEPKRWYADAGKWLVLLLVLGMIYLIYWFYKSQGGLPHEFYDLIRRIGL